MARLALLSPAPLALVGLLFAALGAVELWLGARAGMAPGLLVGAAVLGLLLLATVTVSTRPRGWKTALGAALLSLGEFVFGASVLAAVVPAAAVSLPLSLSARLLGRDVVQDLVVFSLLGLAFWIAARSWVRHSRRVAQAAQAQLDSARARAELAERDRQLADSELLVLRAQVEPHFLWNTLGHVQHLIRRNPADADRLTGHLIRYLRAAVPQMRKGMSSLGAEFASGHAYLELMKIRMGDRLTVRMELPAALQEEPFAPLLVQTLIENAIKHGVEPKVGPVFVEVVAHAMEERMLHVEVRDNGVGLHASACTQGTGLGLRNVRERMALLYGDAASLTITEAAGGGVVARMRVPRGTMPAESAAP